MGGMKAAVYERYGTVDELRIEEVPVPVPAAGEVLVRVVATSVNLSDWETLRGSPAYARTSGLFRPGRRILGSDIAGEVVAVGPGVSRFAVGDAVYGDILQRKGGFAEYAVAHESELAAKPAELSFAEASTIPQAGAIAQHGVARGRPGDRMLVNGAGGGSGMFLIQLATAAGMHVTAVDNGEKLAFMQSLGADDVIDYRTTDYTRSGPYDVIIDMVARRSMFAYRRALAPGGRFFMVGGTTRALLRALTLGTLIGAVSGRRIGILAVGEGPEHFEPVAAACVAGDVGIRIDSEFGLGDIAAALSHHGEGHALGKVVVRVAPE
ncbi:NADPH:quinone reductase [Microbacterium thalassium]|nr:NADPH:quinone reductase [Microbacterium thalassium]